MAKRNQTTAPATTAPATTAPAAPATGTLALLQGLTQAATANVTATASKVPASIATLASITATPTTAAGTLPTAFVPFAGYTVQLTAKGAAARALQARMLPTAKHGACPFLLALYNGQGQTLGSAWAGVTATGHGQQGRGAGGYTAAQALTYYTKQAAWFTLVAPQA